MAESQTSEIWRVQILDVLFMRGADVGGRQQDVGRSPPERCPGVGRASTDLLITDQNSEGARPISTGLRTTPVSLLTGAGRFLITSFRRAPPEPRPKCDRAHFKQKIRSTPWRIWNSATFGRSTISAGDRWICDVGIKRAEMRKCQNHLRNFSFKFVIGHSKSSLWWRSPVFSPLI